VLDSLGSAVPHGRWWFPFLLAFAAVMSAIRVLICWVWRNTNSLLLAQLFHASSTGALAAFSPSGVTAGQEVFWYIAYAAVLWSLCAAILARCGTGLTSGGFPAAASAAVRTRP
jgi:hypothetical protein